MAELKTETLVMLGVALAAVYLVQKAGSKVVQAAKDVVPYVNPADEKNVINQGVQSLYQAVTGSTGTIGGDIYDVTHDGSLNPTSENNVINRGAESLWRSATGSTGTIGGDIYDVTHDGSLNPTSENNVINRGAESLWQWATGSKGTIGGDIYDWLH
ncbi:MAG: hypothetical protein ACXU9C_01625 [Xanthobacteraceae bacterium]